RYRAENAACSAGRSRLGGERGEGRSVDQLAGLRRIAPGQRLQRLALILALELLGAGMAVAETTVIGRITQHHGQRLAGLLEADMRLADQCAADPGAVAGRLARQRRQRQGREALAPVLHEETGKQDVADDLAVFFCYQ